MQDTPTLHDPIGWHGTTILCVRHGGQVAMAGDGQVTMGQTVIKGNARKVRRIGAEGGVITGFAGATADAFTLLERLEAKLERYPANWNAPVLNWRATGAPTAICGGWKP